MFRKRILFGAVAAGLAASLAGCAPVGCAGYGGYGGLELYIGGYYGGYRYFGGPNAMASIIRAAVARAAFTTAATARCLSWRSLATVVWSTRA
jgi:hypothetical protein